MSTHRKVLCTPAYAEVQLCEAVAQRRAHQQNSLQINPDLGVSKCSAAFTEHEGHAALHRGEENAWQALKRTHGPHQA